MKKVPLTKNGFDRLTKGHPWIFSGHLTEEFRAPVGPAIIPLGEHWFLFSPHSQIRLRRLGPAQRYWPAGDFESERKSIENLEDFRSLFGTPLKQLIQSAWLRKRQYIGSQESCFRWIFSEADEIPGLVVDVFGETLIVQVLTAPIEKFLEFFVETLSGVFEEQNVKVPQIQVLKNSPSRIKEGLRVEEAPALEREWRFWNGLWWWMQAGSGGQKTGTYLDQKENHLLAASWAQRLGLKKAWDVCSYEGGFALHLAKAGLEVEALDISEPSLSILDKNAQKNGLSERIFARKADAFQDLRNRFDKKERCDLVVLDPPSFVKSREEVAGAMRGFKELNLRALHCLNPGGMLLSCSCSHHMSLQGFETMLREAAHDARRSVRVLELKGPAPDHAPLLGVPESAYLQAWFLEVLS